MILLTPSPKPDLAAVRDDALVLAQLRHEIFSASKHVRAAIEADDVFVRRLAELETGHSELLAEADRLEAAYAATPTGAALSAAAVRRACTHIAKCAVVKAREGINVERYRHHEATRAALGRVCVALFRKCAEAAKKLPEAATSEVHSARLLFVSDCEGAIEHIEKGASVRIGAGADPLEIRLRRLRGYLQKPERQPDPVNAFAPVGKATPQFAFVEPAAAKEARANAFAEHAKEESRKHGFVTAYLQPSENS